MPDEFNQPAFTDEQIEALIWTTLLDNIDPEVTLRLVIATIYGTRVGELVELTKDDIQLNRHNSTIFIRTEKGGGKKPQPIPTTLVPLFVAPITPAYRGKLQRQLKKLCKKAGIDFPHRSGFHSTRRAVVRALHKIGVGEIDEHRFMRWAEPCQFSMLARYIGKEDIEATDAIILNKHPYVAMWEQVTPYLLKWPSHWESYHSLLHYS